MSHLFYTQVPTIGGHSHFTNDIIESFPDLHAHGTFGERQQQIKEEITYQLLTTKPEDARTNVILRECFKLQNRDRIDFCLSNKAPGVSFVDAATRLGYRKH